MSMTCNGGYPLDAPFVGECEESGSDVRAELRLVGIHGVKRRNEGGVAEGPVMVVALVTVKVLERILIQPRPPEMYGSESPQASERCLDNRVEHVTVEIRIGGEKPAGGLGHPEVSEDLGADITPKNGELETSGQAAVGTVLVSSSGFATGNWFVLPEENDEPMYPVTIHIGEASLLMATGAGGGGGGASATGAGSGGGGGSGSGGGAACGGSTIATGVAALLTSEKLPHTLGAMNV
jgi:uncharacterized membrane protein YgcG